MKNEYARFKYAIVYKEQFTRDNLNPIPFYNEKMKFKVCIIFIWWKILAKECFEDVKVTPVEIERSYKLPKYSRKKARETLKELENKVNTLHKCIKTTENNMNLFHQKDLNSLLKTRVYRLDKIKLIHNKIYLYSIYEKYNSTKILRKKGWIFTRIQKVSPCICLLLYV